MSEFPGPGTGGPRSTWREWLARLLGSGRTEEEPARADDFERTYWRTAEEMGDVLPQADESETERRQR